MGAPGAVKRTGEPADGVGDLTRQLGEGHCWNGQGGMERVGGRGEEPLEKLQAADVAVRDQLEALGDGDQAAALAGILNGGPPLQPGERTQQMLCDQVAANRRRLKQIMELDRVLNQRMGRESTAPQPGELRG